MTSRLKKRGQWVRMKNEGRGGVSKGRSCNRQVAKGFVDSYGFK